MVGSSVNFLSPVYHEEERKKERKKEREEEVLGNDRVLIPTLRRNAESSTLYSGRHPQSSSCIA